MRSAAMQNTIEVYAYICFGIAGAPMDKLGMHVTDDPNDQPRPRSVWAGESYWALSADGSGKYPPVLMHIYYEGELPAESVRDEINHHVKRLTGQLLFNQK